MKLKFIILIPVILLFVIECVREGKKAFPLLIISENDQNVKAFTSNEQTTRLTLIREEGFIELKWVPVEGAFAYKIYRSEINITEPSDSDLIYITDKTLYRDYNVVNYTTYYYTVVPLFYIKDGPASNVASIDFSNDWYIKWVIPSNHLLFTSKPAKGLVAFKYSSRNYSQSIIVYNDDYLSLYGIRCVIYSFCSTISYLHNDLFYYESLFRMQLSLDRTEVVIPESNDTISEGTYLSIIHPFYIDTTSPLSLFHQKIIKPSGINMVALKLKEDNPYDSELYMAVSVVSPPSIELYYKEAPIYNFKNVTNGILETNVGQVPAALIHPTGNLVYIFHSDNSGNLTVSRCMFFKVNSIPNCSWLSQLPLTDHNSFSVNEKFSNTIKINRSIYFIGNNVNTVTLYEYNIDTNTITGTKPLGYGISFVKMVDKYLTYVDDAGVHVIPYPFISSQEIDPAVHKLNPPPGKDMVILDVVKLDDNSYNFFYWTDEDGSPSIKVRITR